MWIAWRGVCILAIGEGFLYNSGCSLRSITFQLWVSDKNSLDA
jgi:hypothetical protein